MKNFNKVLCSVFFLGSLSGSGHAGDFQLEPLWNTEAVFQQPESVVYDIVRRSIYVSSINGAPDAVDGNGFISLVANDGKVEKLKWVDGLNAPKGLALRGKQLFVSDINELLVIDVETAKVVKRFTASEKSFLNDVAIASDGTVFVTDTATNRIYWLHQGEFDVWLEDKRLAAPNGLYIDNNNLMVGSWGNPTDGWNTDVPGHVLMVSLEDKSISDFGTTDSVGNLDGIVKCAENSYLLTDWMKGSLLQLDADGSVETLLELKQGAADMLLLRSKKLLLIPHMTDGVLMAYRLQKNK
ncbi:MAG: hypothetical protein V7739_21715 [Motiliproteus sp.]